MKRSFIVLSAFGVLSACGVLGLFGNSLPDAPLNQTAIPAWDGNHILCSEDVSFAMDSTDALPEFDADERLGFCIRSIKYLELHRQFGDRTTYFGVAAALTGSLAATYAPLVRRAYSPPTWEFMQSVNLALDANVDVASAALAAGARGGQNFTRRTIANGQNDVQSLLDALQAESPETYAQVIEDLSSTLNPTNPLLLNAINRNPFFAAYEASLAGIRQQVGGNVDYSQLEHRLEIDAALDSLISNIAPHPEATQ